MNGATAVKPTPSAVQATDSGVKAGLRLSANHRAGGFFGAAS